MGPEFGNCLQCGSWGLNDCKHKRVYRWCLEGILSMYLTPSFSFSGGKKEKQGCKTLPQPCARPRWSRRTGSGLATVFSGLTEALCPTRFFLTNHRILFDWCKQKRIESKDIRLFTNPLQGPKIHVLFFSACLTLTFSSAGSLYWVIPIFFKKCIWVINFDTYFNCICDIRALLHAKCKG